LNKINKNDKNQIVEEQRIDNWLFRSRLIKSRAKAQKIILDGYVKINKIRTLKPSVKIKIGDIVTLTKIDSVFILSVESFAKNRLNAKEAMKLYKEIKIM
jgi:ribosome-associated heat shock protein Hsp15|tara:strand:+ start:1067 stop:1366 length:300 start_codon:yes stop_codon:yes gene_type:complete